MIKIVRSLGTTYSGIHNVLLMECIQNKQYFARAMIPTVHFFFVLFIRAHSRMILYMKLFAWDNQIPRCWRIFCMRSVWCGYYMCWLWIPCRVLLSMVRIILHELLRHRDLVSVAGLGCDCCRRMARLVYHESVSCLLLYIFSFVRLLFFLCFHSAYKSFMRVLYICFCFCFFFSFLASHKLSESVHSLCAHSTTSIRIQTRLFWSTFWRNPGIFTNSILALFVALSLSFTI